MTREGRAAGEPELRREFPGDDRPQSRGTSERAHRLHRWRGVSHGDAETPILIRCRATVPVGAGNPRPSFHLDMRLPERPWSLGHDGAARPSRDEERLNMNVARRFGTWGVVGGLIGHEIEDHAGVVRSRWARQQESPMLPATDDDEHGDGPMAAAYGRGLADGQAGLDYQVPPARDGRVRFARCYRHGYEHGAAIRARKSAS